MAEYNKHLYMVVFPINALVASQLAPDQFAEHYTIGSSKHFRGKVIFAEIDINYRDPYFKIDHYLGLTVPHEDGTPKRTKFVKSYGVIEHIDFKALKDLYLVLPNGKCLPLKQQPYTAVNEPGLVRVYQGITPLTAMVASTLDQRSFAKYLAQSESKGAPSFCFTQYEFNVEEFLKQNANREMMHSPFPDTNPRRLYEYIMELRGHPEKQTKTVSLNSAFGETSFSLIRHGFWFATKGETLFFPMPSQEQLNNEYYYWWKHVV
jgi:hypothetical protein